MLNYLKIKRVATPILLVILFFGLGVHVGYNNRPEVDKVVGISNKETTVITKT